jgi:hypothetical protein
MDVVTQCRVGDANEAPGLHQPDARCGVRGLEKAGQHLVGNCRAGDEPAHVAALGDHPVDRAAVGRTERVVGHGDQLRSRTGAAPAATSKTVAASSHDP